MWLVPSAMAATAVAGALALGAFEPHIELPPSAERLVFHGDAAGARAILAAIAGSMIGVTGVTFSITIVTLSLASSQFGPRLLRNFLRDRGNQIVLGAFIATFAFCLLGLRNIRGGTSETDGTYLTVVVAVLLALMSLGLLIYFIHHIATSIQADTVIARVGSELEATIDRLYPHELGLPAKDDAEAARGRAALADAVHIDAPRSGYLQSIDLDQLMALAKRHDLVIAIDRRPGQFVIAGRPLMRAAPAARVDEATKAALARLWIVGDHRTAEQDVEFLVHQLVETASRALSPGINDPFTAMTCIDRLGGALARLSVRELPPSRRADEDGNLRVLAATTTYAGLLDAAFNQIRQYAASSVDVLIRLLETLETLAEATRGDPTRQAIVRAHADRVLRTSRLEDHEETDAHEIEDRHARVLAALSAA